MERARGGGTGQQPCVLLVEDEMCLAMMLQDLLEDAGYRVVKASRIPAALSLAEEEDIDAAILDVNVAGRDVFPVADQLRRRGVPFMFASGYGDRGLPGEFRGYPMLQKPYDPVALGSMLGHVLAPSGASLSCPRRGGSSHTCSRISSSQTSATAAMSRPRASASVSTRNSTPQTAAAASSARCSPPSRSMW